MKSTRARILSLLAFTALCTGANAQDFKDRFFFAHGLSAYSDAVLGREILKPIDYDTNFTKAGTAIPTSNKAISIGSYTAYLRINIIEFNNNSSMSLGIPVGVGIMSSEYGFGNLNIPLFLVFNTGNVSTYSSDVNKGFTIGIGVEYQNLALFKNSDYTDYTPGAEVALEASSFIDPCINIGYRYWGNNNNAQEINFKFGYGPAAETIAGGHKYELGNALVLKLTFFFYSKY